MKILFLNYSSVHDLQTSYFFVITINAEKFQVKLTSTLFQLYIIDNMDGNVCYHCHHEFRALLWWQKFSTARVKSNR